MFISRANAKVAAFIRTDVTKYKDNVAMFKVAETEFGGVDVSELVAISYNMISSLTCDMCIRLLS